MQLLPSHKITSEILDIIIQAKERIVLVSPYVDFRKWPRLSDAIVYAIKSGIKVDFYVRCEPENAKSWEQVENLGIKPKLVRNLHAKFYYNECTGIIASMNLLLSSSSNAVEIGCRIQDKLGIYELDKFVDNYINPAIEENAPDDTEILLGKEKFSKVLTDFISYNLDCNCHVNYRDGQLELKVQNESFTVNLDKLNNTIRMTAILSSLQFESFSVQRSNFFQNSFFKLQAHPSTGRYHAYLAGISSQRFSNANFDFMRVSEKKILLHEITSFIDSTLAFKSSTRR